MHELFGIAAASLVVAAYIPYMIKIFKDAVKPHPFTWLIWTITSTSIFFLQLSNGSGAGTYGTATMAIISCCVFLLSTRRGMPKVKYIDVICLIVALLGISVWLVIKEPIISIVLLLSVELIGFLPTLLKAWSKPYEDSAALWGLTGLRHTMSFLAVQQHNIITVLNPTVWMTASFGFSLFLLIRRIPAKKPKRRVKNVQPFSS